MYSFCVPRDTVFGPGTLSELKNLPGQCAVLCVGKYSQVEESIIQNSIQFLQDGGMDVHIHQGLCTKMDPITMGRRADILHKIRPDWIIALGDNSVIDAAKILWMRYEHSDLSLEQLKKVYSLPPLRQHSCFCSVPTSIDGIDAVTSYSVFLEEQERRIIPIADLELVPDRALFDPDILRKKESRSVAEDGFSCLAAAVEAYLSISHNDYSDTLALRSIALIGNNIHDAVAGESPAMERMLQATIYAGAALSTSAGGLTHCLSHALVPFSLGQGILIPHGLICAIALPRVVCFIGKDPDTAKRCMDILSVLGIHVSGEKESIPALTGWLNQLRMDFELPEDLRKYRTSKSKSGRSGRTAAEDDFRSLRMEEKILSDPFLAGSPCLPSIAEAEALVQCCFDSSLSPYHR